MGSLCLWMDAAGALVVFDTLDGFVDVVIGERRVTLDPEEVADLVETLQSWQQQRSS